MCPLIKLTFNVSSMFSARRLLCLSFMLWTIVPSVEAQKTTPPKSQPAIATTFCPKGSKGFFILYYGEDFTIFNRIRQLQPDFVILPELSKQQLKNGYLQKIYDAFHHNATAADPAIRSVIYAHTHRSAAKPKDIDSFVRKALKVGYEGIFFDDVEADSYDYNYARAKVVKDYDKSRIVIMNPGLVIQNKSMFDYADIVSVENRWFDPLPVWADIQPYRWLAVQGDPSGETDPQVQIPTTNEQAIARLIEFRSGKHKSGEGGHGFWYYSSGPHHWQLPSFDLDRFKSDIQALEGESNSCPLIADVGRRESHLGVRFGWLLYLPERRRL